MAKLPGFLSAYRAFGAPTTFIWISPLSEYSSSEPPFFAFFFLFVSTWVELFLFVLEMTSTLPPLLVEAFTETLRLEEASISIEKSLSSVAGVPGTLLLDGPAMEDWSSSSVSSSSSRVSATLERPLGVAAPPGLLVPEGPATGGVAAPASPSSRRDQPLRIFRDLIP